MDNKYYYSDGTVLYYADYARILHRLNGPAIELVNGYKEWYRNGKLHRLDGPAIDGLVLEGVVVNRWYKNGKLHRLGGPAIEDSTGTKHWLQNGLLHRLDGPAIEWCPGINRWYIDGKQFTKEEFEKTILTMKLSGLLDG